MNEDDEKDFRKLKIKSRTVKNPYKHYPGESSPENTSYEASYLGSFNGSQRSIEFDGRGDIQRFGADRFLPNGAISLNDLRKIIEDLTSLEAQIRETIAAEHL